MNRRLTDEEFIARQERKAIRAKQATRAVDTFAQRLAALGVAMWGLARLLQVLL